ncbi:MAG: RidA family protein [Phycisphaerales bacterium]|nr:RidA family protein [Phycisphaerales bacterium]
MTADRQLISSGTPWERRVGYSRAVRVGQLVFVSGTIASDESGRIHAPGDAGEQTRYVLAKIGLALAQAGASLADVVRVRVFLVDMADLEAVGRAHQDVFAEIRPANTTVAVSALASSDCRVEIEVDAVIGA